MSIGLEDLLVVYADDAALIVVVPSLPESDLTSISESLNRDLAKISAWCSLWVMKLKPSKTQNMIVSRSRTVNPLIVISSLMVLN